MEWLQLNLPTSKDTAEELGDLLTELGAVSITFSEGSSQPIYQSVNEKLPLWDAINLTALFPSTTEPNDIEECLRNNQKVRVVPKHDSWKIIAEEDWQNKWKEFFEPMQFADKLWICPAWEAPPEQHKPTIMLEPEMAFGTGSHDTTSLCLQWLAENIHNQHDVIDYGCGSGILAIAAAKLGANNVYAIDIDPVAEEVSAKNAEKNNVTINMQLPVKPVDVVIANILAHP